MKDFIIGIGAGVTIGLFFLDVIRKKRAAKK
jgi:predicted small secreted protein